MRGVDCLELVGAGISERRMVKNDGEVGEAGCDRHLGYVPDS